MSEFDEKIKKFKKIEKSACILGKPLLYEASTEREGTEKHKKLIWLRGQAVKTLASHAGIRGSIPLGVTGKSSYLRAFFVHENLCRDTD